MTKKWEAVYTRNSSQVVDPLAIASYLVIDKHEKYTGKSPSGLYFNKLMSLVDRKLRGSVNLKLPHCWYRYGDEVVRAAMPYNVKWDHMYDDKTIVTWKGDIPMLDDSIQVRLITGVIDELTNAYAENVNLAVHEVYKFAPFEFQRQFLNVREIFYGMNNAFNWDANTYLTLSAPQFFKALNSFPSHEFPQLKERLQITRQLAEITLNNPDVDNSILKDIMTTFWFHFCYYLRTHDEAHDNVPENYITYWNNILETEDARYRKIYADIIEKISYSVDISGNKLLSDELNWKLKDDDEALKGLDEFEDDLASITMMR